MRRSPAKNWVQLYRAWGHGRAKEQGYPGLPERGLRCSGTLKPGCTCSASPGATTLTPSVLTALRVSIARHRCGRRSSTTARTITPPRNSMPRSACPRSRAITSCNSGSSQALSNRMRRGASNRHAHKALKAYDRTGKGLDKSLSLLREYDLVHDGRKDRTADNRTVLQDQPWKRCPCDICRRLGIHVVLFRETERINRRRGFHNLFVTYRRVHAELARMEKVG